MYACCFFFSEEACRVPLLGNRFEHWSSQGSSRTLLERSGDAGGWRQRFQRPDLVNLSTGTWANGEQRPCYRDAQVPADRVSVYRATTIWWINRIRQTTPVLRCTEAKDSTFRLLDHARDHDGACLTLALSFRLGLASRTSDLLHSIGEWMDLRFTPYLGGLVAVYISRGRDSAI